jgi:predicted Zn-dependent protease
VEALGHPPFETWFEVVDPTRAAALGEDLRQLETALGSGVPPSSLAEVRSGALAAEGLLHDARLVALAALARDPDEPTLHILLGNLYLKTGLPQLAAESLDEAQFLLTREGK